MGVPWRDGWRGPWSLWVHETSDRTVVRNPPYLVGVAAVAVVLGLAVLLPLALVTGSRFGVTFVLVWEPLVLGQLVWAVRSRLVVDGHGLEVACVRRRRVAWADVEGLRLTARCPYRPTNLAPDLLLRDQLPWRLPFPCLPRHPGVVPARQEDLAHQLGLATRRLGVAPVPVLRPHDRRRPG